MMAPGRQHKLHAPSPPLAAHGLLLLLMMMFNWECWSSLKGTLRAAFSL